MKVEARPPMAVWSIELDAIIPAIWVASDEYPTTQRMNGASEAGVGMPKTNYKRARRRGTKSEQNSGARLSKTRR